MSHADVQAEKAVLGAVLASATRAQVGDLRPEDFSEPAHQHIWEAVCGLFAQGASVDHLSLSESLKVRGRLVEVGGPAYIMRLDVSEDGHHRFWSDTSVRQHVAILKDRAMRRALAAHGKRLEAASYDLNLRPDIIASSAVQALLASETRTQEEPPDIDIAELAEQWFDFMERVASGVPTGLDNGFQLRTGIEVLDTLFAFVNNLNVIGGRASMGKTALVAEIIWNWLRSDIRGGIVGLEDGTKWLTRRHLSRSLGLPVANIGACRLHEHQMGHLQDWMDRTSAMYRKSLKIHRAGGIDAPGLIALVQRWIGDGLRWIVIDHGLRVSYGEDKRYDRKIGITLDQLATLGDRHKVAIIVNWHLNRDGEDEVRPKMRDYKESGYLDAAARAMLGLWEQKARPGFLLATGVKATEGKRDWTVAIPRDAEHALVHSVGGYEVDFAGEAQAAKEAAATEKQARAGGARNRLLGGGNEVR